MLVVFTLFVPTNGGLERFNYLATQNAFSRIIAVRGEDIPELVEQSGQYGWTANDLYNDYRLSRRGASLRVIRFVSWPEERKPQLCLLGPEEYSLRRFEPVLYSYLGTARIAVPDKYVNLAWQYFSDKRWSPSVRVLEGQVDRQIRLGNADLAVDIVYSGKTRREEQLNIYDLIFNQAGFVLITKDI